MKPHQLISRAAVFLVIGLGCTTTFAVTLSAEDFSNRIITCESPLLAKAPAGSCLSVPDHTLYVTASLDEGDAPELLDEIDVVVQVGTRLFLYDASSNSEAPLHRWKELNNTNSSAEMPPPSFRRLPFETRSVTRQINYQAIRQIKGAGIYLGIRNKSGAPYAAKSVRKVFSVD